MISWRADQMAECYRCNRRSPKDAFGLARVRRVVAECRECGADVSLTPSNFGFAGLGYICSQCGNYVAASYGMQTVDPTTALNPNWNPTIQKRGDPVDKNTVLMRCRTKKDFLVVRLLQVAAKAEDSRLMFARDEDQDAGLYFDTARRKYLGFIVWSVSDEHAVLRQIFIVPDERRKGLAAKLVSFWVEHYADKVNDTFGIESPNEKALNLHTKLGHARMEGDSVKGLKCFFVSGL
jgi:GNAT superfamily N-acetyltransferase